MKPLRKTFEKLFNLAKSAWNAIAYQDIPGCRPLDQRALDDCHCPKNLVLRLDTLQATLSSKADNRSKHCVYVRLLVQLLLRADKLALSNRQANSIIMGAPIGASAQHVVPD